MSNVKQTFQKVKERVQGFFTPSPDSNLTPEAVKQRRNEAFLQFIQGAATALMGIWLAPVFFGQSNLVIIAAVLCAIPFVVQGLKIWMSAPPVTKTPTASNSPSPPRPTTRTKVSSPTRHQPKSANSPRLATKIAQADTTPKITLSDLQQQGWKITYDLPLPDIGDVDVFLQSPKNNYFIVDVQSCRGEVFFDEGVLKRRDGTSVANFEKDLLQQVAEQALAVKNLKRLRCVTPILCFTEAKLSIETVNNKARDVYVVKKDSLVRKLVRLDGE